MLKATTSAAAESKVSSALAVLTMKEYDQAEYIAVLATTDNPVTSVDWRSHSRTVDSTLANPVAGCSAGITHPHNLPFVLDTGATHHITPKTSDLGVLMNIPRLSVKGMCSWMPLGLATLNSISLVATNLATNSSCRMFFTSLSRAFAWYPSSRSAVTIPRTLT